MATQRDDDRRPAGVSPYAAMFLGLAAAKRLARDGETRPLDAMERAQVLRSLGASERAVYAETSRMLDGTPYAGVSYDAAGKARFELSDHDAKLRRFGLPLSREGHVADVLEHPSLDRAMGSAVLPVQHIDLDVKGGIADGSAIYLGNKQFGKPVAGRSALAPDTGGVLLHELQHVAQLEDGRPAGGSPKDFERQFPGQAYAQTRRALYRSIAGENEAELTRLSADMTPAERRASHPDDRAKALGQLPRSEQIIMDGQGRIQERSKRLALMADDIEDFGEKIGGARKDTARKGRTRVKADADAPKVPAWEKQFIPMKSIRSDEWTVASVRGRFAKTVARGFKSEAEAKAAVPLAAVSSSHIVSADSRSAEGKMVYGIKRKTTHGYVPAAGGKTFGSRDEAMRYMAQNAVDLLSQRTPQGYTEALLRQAKVTHKERVGPAVRAGSVSPDDFMKTFGPRGVEFGHWEEGVRRQKLLDAAYDAMHDLARATGLKPNQVTLGGQLGVSFGARGTGGLKSASATYHPDYGTMNLTKPAGAGALAHEWFHALDHALGRQDDPATLGQKMTNSRGDMVWRTQDDLSYASTRTSVSTPRSQALNGEVRKAYADLMQAMTKKAVAEIEPIEPLQRSADYGRKSLERSIASARQELEREVSYRTRGNKPATPEQLAKFDATASRILEGKAATPEWKFAGDQSAKLGARGSMTYRYVSPELDELSGIMREVRGRSGFDTQGRNGPLDAVARDMVGQAKIAERIANAKAGKPLERLASTDFLKNAQELDKTRSSPYWTQRLEMFARAGEAYIHDKLAAQKQASPYLVGGTINSFEAARDAMAAGIEGSPKPFPEGAERALINSKFDALFDAIRRNNLVGEAPNTVAWTPPKGAALSASSIEGAMKQASAPQAAPEVPGKGPAGWSDAAREASAEARGVAAPGEAKPQHHVIRDLQGRIVDLEKGGDELRARAEAERARGNEAGAEALADKAAAAQKQEILARSELRRAIRGGPGASGEAKPVDAPVKPAVVSSASPADTPAKGIEVRQSGKRFEIFEDGKPALDSKGNPRWFGSKDKAEAFVARRRDGAPGPVARDAAAKPSTAAPTRVAQVGDNGAPDLDRLTRAADRLEAVAKRTIERAEAEANRPRLMNTARRARMGSGVIEQAQQDIADAKTALKIAEALRRGEAGDLSNVKSLADIRALRQLAREAERATDRKLNRNYKEGGHGLDRADIANLGDAKGFVRLEPRELDEFKAALAGKKGLANDFRTLERYAQTRASATRTDFTVADPAVFKSMRNVANAIKASGSLKTKYPHEVASLKYRANRFLDEIRDFSRATGVAGTDAATRQKVLGAFLDVREGKRGIDPAKAAELDLVGRKLPGFFPTPESLAERMAKLADIREGQTVLEPSAGTGRLADAAKRLGAKVDTVEMASSLRDILAKKGHNIVADDFTSMDLKPGSYDRILMNPPFEKGRDMAHVRRAFEALKPGGKMVAVMGEGAFFRQDKSATEFRGWLEGVRGTSEKLPEGTFKESNTGVNTRLVVIEKPAEIAARAAEAAVKGAGENPGWSDAARAASAEVRAADAAPVKAPAAPNVPQGTSGPSAATQAAKAGDLKGLAAALRTNTTRAAEVLKRYRTGKLSDAMLDKMAPRSAAPVGASPVERAAATSAVRAEMADEIVKPAKPVKEPKAKRGKAAPADMKPIPVEPKGGLIGFQNEATLNKALAAQGKADAGEAKPEVDRAAVTPNRPTGKDKDRALAEEKYGPKPDKTKKAAAPKTPKGPTVADLRAQAKEAGIKGASRMTKGALQDALGKAAPAQPGRGPSQAPKIDSSVKPKHLPVPVETQLPAVVEPVATPLKPVPQSKALVTATPQASSAGQASRMGAKAIAVASSITAGAGMLGLIAADKARTEGKSNARAAGEGVATAGVAAAAMAVAGKGIQMGMKAVASIAPKVAPALGPVGLAVAGAGLAYGAYQGYQKSGTLGGAVVGALSGGEVFEGQKSAATRAAEKADKAKAFEQAAEVFDGQAMGGGNAIRDAAQFEAANARFNAMQAATSSAASGPIEVGEFTRTRRTPSGGMVTEVVHEHTRQRRAR
jgi:protein-L-isoaspartate O-methyltransferase